MKKALTLVLLSVSFYCSAQKVKLELNLQKDSTYYLTTNAKMNIDQLLNGEHQVAITTIMGKLANKVVAVRDTIYELDVQYKGLGMHMELGEKVIDFSSDKDDSFSKLMSTMLNKSFTVMISKAGKIIEVKNTDVLFAGLFDSMPQASDAQKAQLKAQLQQSFGEKSIKGNLQEAFVIFPKAPLSVNGKWVANTNMEAAAVSSKTKTTYTLNSITGDYYEIGGAAIVSADKDAAYKQSSSMFMRLTDINGTTTTTLKLDKKTCWITEAHILKNVKGTMEIKKELSGAVLMTYPMIIDANSTLMGK